jgi:hypothetical protein
MSPRLRHNVVEICLVDPPTSTALSRPSQRQGAQIDLRSSGPETLALREHLGWRSKRVQGMHRGRASGPERRATSSDGSGCENALVAPS